MLLTNMHLRGAKYVFAVSSSFKRFVLDFAIFVEDRGAAEGRGVTCENSNTARIYNKHQDKLTIYIAKPSSIWKLCTVGKMGKKSRERKRTKIASKQNY
jgi:hypothetical protein